jgi:hypothetical protein
MPPHSQKTGNLYDPDTDLDYGRAPYGSAPMSVQFLKRYRLYARAVCEVAQKCWPEHDLDWLFQQA